MLNFPSQYRSLGETFVSINLGHGFERKWMGRSFSLRVRSAIYLTLSLHDSQQKSYGYILAVRALSLAHASRRAKLTYRYHVEKHSSSDINWVKIWRECFQTQPSTCCRISMGLSKYTLLAGWRNIHFWCSSKGPCKGPDYSFFFIYLLVSFCVLVSFFSKFRYFGKWSSAIFVLLSPATRVLDSCGK